jgi:hypothetical protein
MHGYQRVEGQTEAPFFEISSLTLIILQTP